MKKIPLYWEDSAMLLLVPAILVFFLNIGMWLGVLGGKMQWYGASLITLSTIVVPTILFSKYIEANETDE